MPRCSSYCVRSATSVGSGTVSVHAISIDPSTIGSGNTGLGVSVVPVNEVYSGPVWVSHVSRFVFFVDSSAARSSSEARTSTSSISIALVA
jgi:hypothetical protein